MAERFEIDLSPEALARNITTLRNVGNKLSLKDARTLHEEAVFQVLLSLFLNSIPPVERIIIEEDTVKVEPEKGIAYTSNYSDFFEPRNGKFKKTSLWELIAKGYTIVNPVEPTLFETDKYRVATKRGQTVKTNVASLDPIQLLERVSEVVTDSRTIVSIIDDGEYLEISSLTSSSYAVIVIDKKNSSVLSIGGYGDGKRAVSSVLVPVLRAVGVSVKDVVVSMAVNDNPTETEGVKII